MQIPQKDFSPVGTSFYFYANPSKKNPLYYHSGHVFARNAVAICLAAGKGDRIVGRKTLSTGASEKGILQPGIVDRFL